MTDRIDYQKQSPELFKKFLDFNMVFGNCAIEETIRDLVDIRASQLNGCPFCLDMHVKSATIHGERPLRLSHVAIWRESTLFRQLERAALAWTEILPQIPTKGVPQQLYDRVRHEFPKKKRPDQTYLFMPINPRKRDNVQFKIKHA